METRVCVVGKKNIDNEELMKALEVRTDCLLFTIIWDGIPVIMDEQ